MVRIMLVDDHAIVRIGIRQALAKWPGIVIAAEAASAQEALDLALSTELDIVVLDIGMPGRGGLDVLHTLRPLKPALKFVMLSMYPEEQYAIRCFKDGASAYVTKDSPPEELVKAIRAVAEGKRYITPSLGQQMAGMVLDAASRPLHEVLSDREFQVLLKIGAGKRVNEIAEELALSPKTVSTYRTRILEKLDMENTAQLIKYVMQEGLA
jgi:DNA-binding NarL/FixJ family response regulator